MIVNICLPLLIGALGVLQNTLNRQLSPAFGLPWLLLINGLVLAACGILFFLSIRILPPDSLPPIYRMSAGARLFEPASLVPGLFGFFIIASAPWAIERMGATRVFIGIIAAQLLVSMLWDWLVESASVSAWRLVGAALALLGAALAAL